jgi:pilus assembly protein FimV
VQSLIQQGWVLPAALGLLAVLLGLAFSRISRRKKTALAPVSSLQEAEPAANDQSMADSTAQSLILNLNDINLDLTPSSADTEPDAINGEALFTKLELAKEFLSLGDRVAAKALAEEVQAEATGLLKRRAELLLAELG